MTAGHDVHPDDVTDWLLARVTCPRCAALLQTAEANATDWQERHGVSRQWGRLYRAVLVCTAAGHPGVLHQTRPDSYDPPDQATAQPNT